MTGPLRSPRFDTTSTESGFGGRSSNLAQSTSMSRLQRAIRNARSDGSTLDDVSPIGSGAFGVPNPYGASIDAYEPNTVIFDEYAQAYGAVQSSKAEESAAQELITADFSQTGAAATGGGGVSGVPFAELFTAAGSRYGVPAALLAAVARAESNFSTTARSPAGALGLMQFMPATAAGMGVDPMNPASAIDGAARYLKQNYDRFGSWDLALAAYNAGPGNVSRYGGIPPFAETQAYVQRVNSYLGEYNIGGTSAPAASSSSKGDGSGPMKQADGQVKNMVGAAMNLAARRVPYVWGGTGPNGVDCSGLIYYAAKSAGINLPRLRAVDYGRLGTAVSLQQARPGDIVYYDNPNTDTDHVGIYLGNGQVVQAPQSGDVVKVTGVGNFTSIRRIFEDTQFAAVATPTGGRATSYAGMPYMPALTMGSVTGSRPFRAASTSGPIDRRYTV